MRESLRGDAAAGVAAARHSQDASSYPSEKDVEILSPESTRNGVKSDSRTEADAKKHKKHNKKNNKGNNGNDEDHVPGLDPTEKPNGGHPHGLHGEELTDFPTLDYGISHRRRRTKIALYFLLLLVESCLLPEALFYGLTFRTDTHLQITFAIITALCGTFAPIKFFLGMFKLWRRKTTDRCRPLGQRRRLGFDFFHISTLGGYTVYIVILIIGTAPHEQITPLIAMAVPGFIFWEACVLLFLQLYHHSGAGAPFRISSTAKGERVPAAVYPLIEDVCAVEGHGNREYRERLRARYRASPVFRTMLSQISWFWIVGCYGVVAACSAIIGTTKWYVGFGFGFGLPFAWCIVWSVLSMIWIERSLKKEKATWNVVTKP